MNFGNNLLIAYPKSPDATVQLVQSGGVYPSLGTFTSRIFDRGNVVDPAPWERIIAQAANQFIDSNAPAIELITNDTTIGLWHFNQNYLDSGPNGYDGTPSGNIRFGSGLFGSGYLQFDNPVGKGHVSIGTLNYSQAGEIGSFSFVGWGRWNSSSSLTGAYPRLISFGVNHYWAVNVAKDDKTVVFHSVSASGELHSLSYPQDTGDLEWHHFAVSYNENTGVKKIYLDGVLVAEEAAYPPGTRIGSGIERRYGKIGAEPTDSQENGAAQNQRYWGPGQIDEIAIYNRELLAEEIEDVYLNGKRVPAVVYQMRSSDSAATIATKNFVGPDGTTSTYYHNQLSEGDLLSASATADWNASHQYVQYRAILYPSTDTLQTPGVQEVALVMSDDRRYVDTKLRHFSLGTFSNTETVEE